MCLALSVSEVRDTPKRSAIVLDIMLIAVSDVSIPMSNAVCGKCKLLSIYFNTPSRSCFTKKFLHNILLHIKKAKSSYFVASKLPHTNKNMCLSLNSSSIATRKPPSFFNSNMKQNMTVVARKNTSLLYVH